MDMALKDDIQSESPLTNQELLFFIKEEKIKQSILRNQGLEFIKELSKQLFLLILPSPNDSQNDEDLKKLSNLSGRAILSKESCLNYAYLLFYSDFVNSFIDVYELPHDWTEKAIKKYGDESLLKFLNANVIGYSINARSHLLDDLEKSKSIVRNLIKESLRDPETILNALRTQFEVFVWLLENSRDISEAYYVAYNENVDKNISEQDLIKFVKSLCHARIGRIYSILLDRHNQEIEIKKSRSYFENNSFMLVQMAFMILDENLKESEKHFKKALELLDTQFDGLQLLKKRLRFESYLGLGYIYNKKGLYEQSERLYTEGMNYKFDNVSEALLYLNRGRNKIDKGDLVSAIYDLNMAITLSKEIKETKLEAESHINLGIIYIEQGLYEQAKKEFTTSMELNPSLPHSYYNMGVLYNLEGNKDRAKRLFKTAIDMDTNFNEAREALRKIKNVTITDAGSNFYDWWFGPKTSNMRKIAGILIVIGISLLIFKSIYNVLNDYTVNQSLYIILAIVILLLILPIITRLKFGPVEIDVKTKGENPEITLNASSISIAVISSEQSIVGVEQLFFLNFIIY